MSLSTKTKVNVYIPALLINTSIAVSPIVFLNAWIDSTDETSKTEILAPSDFSCLSLGPSVRDVAYVVYP